MRKLIKFLVAAAMLVLFVHTTNNYYEECEKLRLENVMLMERVDDLTISIENLYETKLEPMLRPTGKKTECNEVGVEISL